MTENVETNSEANTHSPPQSPYQLQSNSNDESETPRTSFEHETTSPGIGVSVSEILYSASSYHAMVVPVSITMILAALAVVFINTDESLAVGEQEMTQFYTVFKSDSTTRANQSTGINLAQSIGNSFIIVTFIGAVTFLIVLLYKFRFMKCLIGYMIFSSASLLGVLGSTVLDVAIEKYRIPVDVFTFYFLIFNFSIAGITAIFFQTGIPMYITQIYLVLTSIILAWQLSHFDPWTTWTLLVFLALYDLCAVLSPCGPLKALVGLMQQENAPDMPGLLYEARLPAGAERRVRRPNNNNSSSNNNNNTNPTNSSAAEESSTLTNDQSTTTETKSQNSTSDPNPSTNSLTPLQDESIPPERIVNLPLAIAKLYRLPLLSSTQQRIGTGADTSNNSNVSTSPLLQENLRTHTHTSAELRANVEVVMPANGGKIVRTGTNSSPKYLVYDREGELRRSLFVDRRGKVMQEIQSEDEDDDDDEDNMRVSNSIRLGLGDFIFYSVLVSKAAMYSFTTFAACMLCILTGMGLTLILLSVYKAALPALPISIFLAVIFYLLTLIFIEPWIEAIMSVPFYV